MTPLIRQPAFDLSKQQDQIAYVEKTYNAAELIHKELDVNHVEQELLQERIKTAKNLLNEFSSDDPNYSNLQMQAKMDQIELDEKKIREQLLVETLEKAT